MSGCRQLGVKVLFPLFKEFRDSKIFLHIEMVHLLSILFQEVMKAKRQTRNCFMRHTSDRNKGYFLSSFRKVLSSMNIMSDRKICMLTGS